MISRIQGDPPLWLRVQGAVRRPPRRTANKGVTPLRLRKNFISSAWYQSNWIGREFVRLSNLLNPVLTVVHAIVSLTDNLYCN